MDHLRTHNSFVNKFLPRQSFYEIYYIIPINIKKELNNIFIGTVNVIAKTTAIGDQPELRHLHRTAL